jgi:hypothetical protein
MKFLLIALMGLGFPRSPALGGAGGKPDLCDSSVLPMDEQKILKKDFGSWKIQSVDNLSAPARRTWEGRKPLSCPGIAAGSFDHSKQVSYAFLLVPVVHPDAGYRLLFVSHAKADVAVTVLDKSDESGASNYFIRKTAISRFFSKKSRIEYRAFEIDGILQVDSADSEYGVDIYFWSQDHFEHAPVDD